MTNLYGEHLERYAIADYLYTDANPKMQSNGALECFCK